MFSYLSLSLNTYTVIYLPRYIPAHQEVCREVDGLEGDAKAVTHGQVQDAEGDGDALPGAEHLVQQGVVEVVVVIAVPLKFELKIKKMTEVVL